MKVDIISVKYGILFGFGTILFGIALGIAFGVAEDSLKGALKQRAYVVLDSNVYKGDKNKADKIWKKSWVYYKRAHLHAGGMGSTVLVVCLILSVLQISQLYKTILSTMMGVGALGYSCFWLFAGMKAPGLGSTGLAKESLSWLAIPSSAVYAIGVLLISVLFIKQMLEKNS